VSVDLAFYELFLFYCTVCEAWGLLDDPPHDLQERLRRRPFSLGMRLLRRLLRRRLRRLLR